MRIDVLTLFAEMFASPLNHSIIKRAKEKNLVDIVLTNIRDFATDRHSKVDDKPYGGGAGMVMMPGPVLDCYQHVRGLAEQKGPVILLTPQGKRFDQQKALQLSRAERIFLIAGRYEGYDERIRTALDADPVSVGDFVVSGGELPAMLIIDAVVRLLPGALGHKDSAKKDSFSQGLLEHPHYTRPEEYRRMKVPEVLLSGDHARIAKWRHEQSIARTRKWRPDLLERYYKSKEE